MSVQDQVDTDSPMGKAMFTVIGAIAALESSFISERVKAGLHGQGARETSRPPCHAPTLCGTHRRAGALDRDEHSSDSRGPQRPREPVGGGSNREVCEKPAANNLTISL